MQHCHCGDAGAVAIIEALKTNKSLRGLILRGNPFSPKVIANEIATMLTINTTLIALDLTDLNERINFDVAEVLLNTLEEYNDTAQVLIDGYDEDDEFWWLNDDQFLRLMLDNIESIGRENRDEDRCAPSKHRRNILKGLKLIWTTMTTDA